MKDEKWKTKKFGKQKENDGAEKGPPKKKQQKRREKKLKARKKQKQNKSTPHRAKQLKWKKNLEIVYLLVVSFAPSWDQTSL